MIQNKVLNRQQSLGGRTITCRHLDVPVRHLATSNTSRQRHAAISITTFTRVILPSWETFADCWTLNSIC